MEQCDLADSNIDVHVSADRLSLFFAAPQSTGQRLVVAILLFLVSERCLSTLSRGRLRDFLPHLLRLGPESHSSARIEMDLLGCPAPIDLSVRVLLHGDRPRGRKQCHEPGPLSHFQFPAHSAAIRPVPPRYWVVTTFWLQSAADHESLLACSQFHRFLAAGEHLLARLYAAGVFLPGVLSSAAVAAGREFALRHGVRLFSDLGVARLPVVLVARLVHHFNPGCFVLERFRRASGGEHAI